MFKKLAAFDFDHTIVDKNSDYVAIDLISRDKIPSSLKKLHQEDGWTNYMQGIFKLLFTNKIKEPQIKRAMEELKSTSGMSFLIKELSEKMNYDVIVISDSNSYFINTWLERNALNQNVLRVFTNPASFENGLLKIKMFHLQDKCKLSTKNLCKGQILEEFISEQRKNGVNYERVVYVGDGGNDFCPILRLGINDLACVRDTYKCAKLIKDTQEGKSVDGSGVVYKIKADVVIWKTGFDILKSIADLPVIQK